MNEIKALAARLIQNPDLVKSLPKVVQDPQAVAQLAGLDEDKMKALTGLGNTLSGLLARLGKPATPRRVSSADSSTILSPQVQAA